MLAPPPPPTLPGASARECLVAFRRDSLGFFRRLTQECGDLAGFSLGEKRADGRPEYVLANRDDLAREVFVTREEEFRKWFRSPQIPEIVGSAMFTREDEAGHRALRRLAAPAFHRQKLHGYAATMTRLATDEMRDWPPPGEAFEITARLHRLTLRIVCELLFGADAVAEAGGEGFIDELNAVIDELVTAGERAFLPVGMQARYAAARLALDRLIFAQITRRRAADDASRRDDVLSLLIAGQTAEGETLSDAEVRGETVTILFAGHETGTVALSWAVVSLAEHPDAEAKLHAELDVVLTQSRSAGFADLARLVWTRAVWQETLRLYPPVWSIVREATHDLALGGVSIPAGTRVIVSPYLLGRDARYFDDPEAFQPARWLNAAGTEVSTVAPARFSFLPFSAGARSCLGEAFAGVQGVLLLAAMLGRWRLRLAPGQQPPTPCPETFLRAGHGLFVVAEPR